MGGSEMSCFSPSPSITHSNALDGEMTATRDFRGHIVFSQRDTAAHAGFNPGIAQVGSSSPTTRGPKGFARNGIGDGGDAHTQCIGESDCEPCISPRQHRGAKGYSKSLICSGTEGGLSGALDTTLAGRSPRGPKGSGKIANTADPSEYQSWPISLRPTSPDKWVEPFSRDARPARKSRSSPRGKLPKPPPGTPADGDSDPEEEINVCGCPQPNIPSAPAADGPAPTVTSLGGSSAPDVENEDSTLGVALFRPPQAIECPMPEFEPELSKQKPKVDSSFTMVPLKSAAETEAFFAVEPVRSSHTPTYDELPRPEAIESGNVVFEQDEYNSAGPERRWKIESPSLYYQ